MNARYIRNGVLLSTALGGALRLVLCLVNLMRPSADLRYVQSDDYMRAASYMLKYRDTTDPVFVPGYTFLVAVLRQGYGSHAVAVLLGLQWLLATGCIVVMFYLARKIGGPLCGLVACLLVAVDPLLIPRSSLVLTEALYIPLLLAAVTVFLFGMYRSANASLLTRHVVISSALVGLSILTRSVGIVMPAAMLAALWLHRALAPRRKAFLSVTAVAVAFLVVLPLCVHNQKKYGHFNVSSSLKFNYAALVVGPTKKIMDGNDGPKLLSMWKADVGEYYETMPPFALADTAARAATRWAMEHPLVTMRGFVRGQLVMLFAPDRSSWAPGVSFFNPSPRMFHAFAVMVALYRCAISMLALLAVVRWRTMGIPGWMVAYLLIVIVCHVVGVGAAGEGRYAAPISPYVDLLSALAIVHFWQKRRPGRFPHAGRT